MFSFFPHFFSNLKSFQAHRAIIINNNPPINGKTDKSHEITAVEDVNSELPSSSKKQEFAGFLEICMVHGGKTNSRFNIKTMRISRKPANFSFWKQTEIQN